MLTARALCATIKYMNDTVIDILYTERVAPPRRFICSDTALYMLLLLGALGRISPLWAAVIHNTATLAVVMNSVRILGPARSVKRF